MEGEEHVLHVNGPWSFRSSRHHHAGTEPPRKKKLPQFSGHAQPGTVKDIEAAWCARRGAGGTPGRLPACRCAWGEAWSQGGPGASEQARAVKWEGRNSPELQRSQTVCSSYKASQPVDRPKGGAS